MRFLLFIMQEIHFVYLVFLGSTRKMLVRFNVLYVIQARFREILNSQAASTALLGCSVCLAIQLVFSAVWDSTRRV